MAERTRIFEAANIERTISAGHRDALRARAVLDQCTGRARVVAEARIADPEAPWSVIAGRLGMTKDQATGLFRRAMTRAELPGEETGSGR